MNNSNSNYNNFDSDSGSEIDFKKEFFKYFFFWKYFVISLVFSITFASVYVRYSHEIFATTAKIQILDKITSKVAEVEIKTNNSIQFESLIIEILSCYKNPPEKIPEDFVLLKILDKIDFESTLDNQE